ncbi:MAG: hypothetical protein LBQ30_06945 [Treponema sp.]|nr:hypothetical protein [Treponema sp.]
MLVREPTDGELVKGISKPKSHFGKAGEKLLVEVIAANSPQAKGRVERNHSPGSGPAGVGLKSAELRLAGIHD